MQKSNNALAFVIALALALNGCSLDGNSELTVSCGTAIDADLLNSTPEDTTFLLVQASEIGLDTGFYGKRRNEPFENPIEGNYENIISWERTADIPGNTLKGVGITIMDPTDSSFATIGFDMPESDAFDQFCRINRSLQPEHAFSRWELDQPGVFIEVRIRNNLGEFETYSTNTPQSIEMGLTLLGAEVLDEFNTYARIEGVFQANMQIENDIFSQEVMEVTGTFIIPIQVGYPF